MEDKKTKWLVRDKKGKIFGPYEYEKLFLFIERGYISGEEEISQYPDGKWFSISKDMSLYSKLLEQLQKNEDVESNLEDADTFYKQESQKYFDGSKPEERSVKGLVIADEDWAEEEESSTPNSAIYHTQTIEVKKKKHDTKRLGRFLIIISLMAIVFLQIAEKRGGNKEESLLLAPQITNKVSKNISRKKKNSQIIYALNLYKLGGKKNYLDSRDVLLSVIEADPANTDAVALLCMVYNELWEFSKKNSNDKIVMNQLVELSTRAETFTAAAGTCKTVYGMIDGKWLEAKSYIQRILEQDSNAVTYYFLKAQALNFNNKKVESISYLQQAYRYWPDWLLPRLLEAEIRMDLGQIANARNSLSQILKVYEGNESAAVLLSYLEMFSFKNSKAAQLYISAFGKNKSLIRPQWQAKAYEVLAALNEGSNKEQAMNYAQEAISLVANSPYARAILSRGGQAVNVNTKSTAEAYIANGDRMMSLKRYFEAQAEYKAAYDLDNKNSMAAMKAANALWKLNQDKEAILWLNKSLQANPRNFEANLLLAKLYGQRYDFLSAANQMIKVQKINHKDYRIYRTYAELEFLRQNYTGAIKNAEAALQRYDADIESLLLLADANLKLEKYREAHYASAKAVELEANNPRSQAKYAQTLAKFQSYSAGVSYIKSLIHTYPSVLEYRQALAQISYEEDKFDVAIQVLKQMESVAEDKLELYLLMSQSYQGKGDLSNALKALLSAAQEKPSDVSIYVKIGKLQMLGGKPAAALKQFLVAQKLNESYPKLNTYIGEANLKMGNASEALKYAQKEILRNPRLAEGYLLAGEAYTAGGQYSKAAGQYQKVIQLNPNSSSLYVKIARSHRLAGNYDLASSMLSVASAKESGNPEVYKETGALLQAKGNNMEAVSAYKKYLSLSPNAIDAKEIRQIILSLGGE